MFQFLLYQVCIIKSAIEVIFQNLINDEIFYLYFEVMSLFTFLYGAVFLTRIKNKREDDIAGFLKIVCSKMTS